MGGDWPSRCGAVPRRGQSPGRYRQNHVSSYPLNVDANPSAIADGNETEAIRVRHVELESKIALSALKDRLPISLVRESNIGGLDLEVPAKYHSEHAPRDAEMGLLPIRAEPPGAL